MAQVQNIDLPRIYAAAENVAGARYRNALLASELENRRERKALIPQALAGDEGALQNLVTIDPQTATALLKMRGEKRDIARQNVEQLARLLLTVEKAPPARKQDAWTTALQTAQQWGVPVDRAPAQYDPQFARMLGAQFLEMDKLLGSEPDAPTVQTFYDAQGLPYKAQWDPQSASWQQVGGSKAPSGIEFEVGPDNQVRFRQGTGVGGGGDLTTSSTSKAEQEILATQQSLDRLAVIEQQFDPSFLEIPTQLAMAYVAGKEKLGFDITPEQKQRLERYTTFQRDAIDNLNRYIKQITGAQMSEAEADRLRLGMPDPKRDGPTEFMSKLQATMRALHAANARTVDALRRGVDPLKTGTPLESIGGQPGQGQQGALPEGVPPGSQRIGTFQGRPVFQTPDGRRLVVE